MQGLGYKEILSYLDGTWSLEEAIYVLKRDTRHFAKRQLHGFRRGKGCALAGLRPVSGKYRPYPCRYIKGLRTGRNRAKIANRKKSNLIKIGVIT